MANFFVVYNTQEKGGTEAVNRTAKSATTLSRAKLASWVKMEAGSLAEAQEVIGVLYGGTVSLPVVVTEAQWKES